jgi:alkanesulfonate monooxygenase SsuD/methylene tetrahydromethanopterin reductase-like flavin-dependent oxidoreductase (luciferase family)
MGYGHDGAEMYGDQLAAGFAKRGHEPESFEIFNGCSVVITDDVKAVLDGMRPLTAMYVGGMGSATHNYHRAAMARRGFPDDAARIQELWLAGRKQEAVDAVPDDYLEQNTLAGTPQRIRQRWEAGFVPAGITGMIVGTDQPEALELMADLAGTREAQS